MKNRKIIVLILPFLFGCSQKDTFLNKVESNFEGIGDTEGMLTVFCKNGTVEGDSIEYDLTYTIPYQFNHNSLSLNDSEITVVKDNGMSNQFKEKSLELILNNYCLTAADVSEKYTSIDESITYDYDYDVRHFKISKKVNASKTIFTWKRDNHLLQAIEINDIKSSYFSFSWSEN